MTQPLAAKDNVKGIIPLLLIADMERSIRFYVDGLDFTIKNRWIVDGKLLWCWMDLGGASLMLQEPSQAQIQSMGSLGSGVGLWLQCEDSLALYRQVTARGIKTSEPQVGNSAWEVTLVDPDGYRIHFSSPTDVPEETLLSEFEATQHH